MAGEVESLLVQKKKNIDVKKEHGRGRERKGGSKEVIYLGLIAC